jgi:membrane protease YdiL (CAAX protease family)
MAGHVVVKVLAAVVPVIAGLVAPAFLPPPEADALLGRQFLLLAWGVGAILAFQRLLFDSSLPGALYALGVAWPRLRAVVVAGLVSLPMWLGLPVIGWITGAGLALHPNWPALLFGVILVNGITEELIHRGFVFGNLRRVSSFRVAAISSAVIFGLQHVYLIFTIGPLPGVMSILLAVALAVPLALHFERGGRSIVAPALLHTSSNAPMVLFAQGEAAASLLLPHMAVVLVSMYLSFLFWRPGSPKLTAS